MTDGGLVLCRDEKACVKVVSRGEHMSGSVRYRPAGSRCRTLADMARILVVEDEAPTRSLVHVVLEDLLGHEVREATCVSEALSVLDEWTPHVVVSDVHLPDAMGTALAGYVRDDPRFEATEVLFLTAYDPPRTGRGEAVLRKPFELEELERTVEELAERATWQEDDGSRREPRDAPWMRRWRVRGPPP